MKIHHILLLMWIVVLFFMLANWYNQPRKK